MSRFETWTLLNAVTGGSQRPNDKSEVVPLLDFLEFADQVSSVGEDHRREQSPGADHRIDNVRVIAARSDPVEQHVHEGVYCPRFVQGAEDLVAELKDLVLPREAKRDAGLGLLDVRQVGLLRAVRGPSVQA